MKLSKRAFLQSVATLIAESLLPRGLSGKSGVKAGAAGSKVVLTIFGGVRDEETFSTAGLENVPHMSQDLRPRSLFFAQARNEGVTAHFNAISSILTGNWQRVDDWGKLAPSTPTVAEYFRKQLGLAQSEAWIVASNKALTSMIGASSARGYGPSFGANVVFPKQLLIAAVEDAMLHGRSPDMGDRAKVQADLESMLQESNYEGLGWTVFGAADRLDRGTRCVIEDAITSFAVGSAPPTGDELTFLVAREVMRKFAPRLLVVIFSDVESAHFGSYSMHVSAIRNCDRLVYELWQEIETNSEYRGQTTMLILPEFGRDPDGSTTNGFLNHRSGTDSCRSTWMMCVGTAVDRPQIISRPIRHIDLCPCMAFLLGCRAPDVTGERLPELKA
jgi:hypothetical protein